MVNVTRLIDAVRTCGLAAVIVTVCLAKPRPDFSSALGTTVAITLAVSAVAWIRWVVTSELSRTGVTSLIVMGVAGGVLAGLRRSIVS